MKKRFKPDFDGELDEFQRMSQDLMRDEDIDISVDNLVNVFKKTREVIKTANGKNIQTTYYNRLTKKGISKEKDITYKTKDQPRIKFIDKQVVKRNQDGDWKSEKVTKKLFKGFKKIKSDEQYNTYKKGGVAKTKKK